MDIVDGATLEGLSGNKIFEDGPFANIGSLKNFLPYCTNFVYIK